MIYKFEAEHISRKTAVDLVHEFEAADYSVDCAGMDPVFSNQMYMCVTCDEATAKVIRDRIWEVNNGASCEMHTITADQLEAML